MLLCDQVTACQCTAPAATGKSKSSCHCGPEPEFPFLCLCDVQVLTPVRRSARHLPQAAAPVQQLLEATEYCYAPNVALRASGEPGSD